MGVLNVVAYFTTLKAFRNVVKNTVINYMSLILNFFILLLIVNELLFKLLSCQFILRTI